MLGDCAEAFPLKWIALRYFNASGSDPDGENWRMPRTRDARYPARVGCGRGTA
jgi:UDP-glucose 4-epimerase